MERRSTTATPNVLRLKTSAGEDGEPKTSFWRVRCFVQQRHFLHRIFPGLRPKKRQRLVQEMHKKVEEIHAVSCPKDES